MTDSIRTTLRRRADERGISLSSLSRTIGRNAAYVQQFVERGTPRRLDDLDRLHIAMALNIDERELGARDPWRPA
jgi:transcriptional regulator with XRE-family HTH domain